MIIPILQVRKLRQGTLSGRAALGFQPQNVGLKSLWFSYFTSPPLAHLTPFRVAEDLVKNGDLWPLCLNNCVHNQTISCFHRNQSGCYH